MSDVRRLVVLVLTVAVALAACGSSGRSTDTRPQVVVTYPVLGAVVAEVVGGAADVHVLMPDGADPHQWSPSARDVERLRAADLVVENGLGLEEGLHHALAQARADGVRMFTAADHVTVRRVRPFEGTDPADADQAAGAEDPHLWTDPETMKQVVLALAPALSAAGVDVGDRAARVAAELDELDAEVRARLDSLPPDRRTLVTGHESLGYFADRYGLRVVGTVVPGMSSQAEPSARDLAALTKVVRSLHVPAVFAEVGTPKSVSVAVGEDAGAKVVALATHTLPADRTYRTFVLTLAERIADGLAA